MGKVLDHLKRSGWPVAAQELDRLSPIIFKHINFFGRHHFDMAESIARDNLRPLLTQSDIIRRSA